MSEALRLADALHREWKDDALNYDTALDAAAELRRLHAENEALRADVAAARENGFRDGYEQRHAEVLGALA